MKQKTDETEQNQRSITTSSKMHSITKKMLNLHMKMDDLYHFIIPASK